jgi:hypothetical protein
LFHPQQPARNLDYATLCNVIEVLYGQYNGMMACWFRNNAWLLWVYSQVP